MIAGSLQIPHPRCGAAATGVPVHPLVRIFSTFREWRRRMRARAELAALNDRMLEVVGITLTEPEFLSREPF